MGAAELAIGFVTNFFDSLGIGSFAPTTSLFKLLALVPDECIPGTLNVGHAIPTVVQAAAFLSIVEVDVTTLVAMIAAAVLGAWLGAGVVAQWPRRHVQVGMGLALIVAASLMLMTNLELFPAGGEALGLAGPKLLFAIGVNFLLGALMTLGIGLYAPCMILVSLLGMSPRAAFPIMMGSCAFLMTAGSLRFIEKRAFSHRFSGKTGTDLTHVTRRHDQAVDQPPVIMLEPQMNARQSRHCTAGAKQAARAILMSAPELPETRPHA